MEPVRTDAAAAARRGTPERHRALQDALVAAADAAVAREGLAGLRARALAERAGCSVGAIYTVFPDLDALALAVNARTLDAIDAAMRAASDGSREPAEAMVRLAEAYLDYVAGNAHRCEALFSHRMAHGRAVPDWYAGRQASVFGHVEQPLAALRPDLPDADRALLARTLFSAVHGIVSLGLDQKLAAIAPATLCAQLRMVVGAMAVGLTPERGRGD